MIVPFLNCIYAGEIISKPYALCHFYSMLEHLKRGTPIPFIAQEQCFSFLPEDRRSDVDPYPIPQELEDSFVRGFSSETEAHFAYLQQVQPVYKELIAKYLDQIQEKYREKVEAVITYYFSPTLHEICRERGIAVFEFEFSPVRKPIYPFSLGYFMQDNKFSCKESDWRYQRFCADLPKLSVPLLSRREIMALLFSDENMTAVFYEDAPPVYEAAVVNFDETIRVLPSDWEMSNAQLIFAARRLFGDSILLRSHPCGRVDLDQFGLDVDHSACSLQFLQKCKRVVCYNSNVGFEGMLLGKPTYELVDMPFSAGTMRSLESDDCAVCSAQYLNFITFCIFTPYELMHQEEYICWRLKNPAEIEIFNFNLQYILEHYWHMPKEVMGLKNGRLDAILEHRGLPPFRYEKRQLANKTVLQPWLDSRLAERDNEIFRLEMELAGYRAKHAARHTPEEEERKSCEC